MQHLLRDCLSYLVGTVLAADAGSPTAIAIRNEGAALLAQTVIATWLGCWRLTYDDAPEIAIQGYGCTLRILLT